MYIRRTSTYYMFSVALGGYPLFSVARRQNIISCIENTVPKSRVVVWRKEMPKLPETYKCVHKLGGLAISIPQALSYNDLYGTHLEVRLMDEREQECLCRFCLWTGVNSVIHFATPNDMRRDIDNLGYDLYTTRRSIPYIEKPMLMHFRKVHHHYFCSLGGHLIPVDYSCYFG